MARKKTTSVRANVKAQVSARLRAVRLEIFGEHGGPELARCLNLPARTWYNYETGVTVPAEVLLGFIQQTRVDPGWLLTGQGPTYRHGADHRSIDEFTPQQLIRRGLEILESQPQEEPSDIPSTLEFLSLDVVPLAHLGDADHAPIKPIGRVLADRRWIAHPEATIATRLEDDAMSPILGSGSMVAIDRTVRNPKVLEGRLIGARVDGQSMVRWLELSGKHLILRPNLPSRDHPSIPIEFDRPQPPEIAGLVVWSWSRFDD